MRTLLGRSLKMPNVEKNNLLKIPSLQLNLFKITSLQMNIFQDRRLPSAPRNPWILPRSSRS